MKSCHEHDEDSNKGIRAENVVNWYFRLNGFLSIPSYIIHLDLNEAVRVKKNTSRVAKTEADLMGVRFSGSYEKIDNRGKLPDDESILGIKDFPETVLALFILVEVKAGKCMMNGPWSNQNEKNMERVIRRLGFAKNEEEVQAIADKIYKTGKWQNEKFVFQYICVGGTINSDLYQKFPDLIQIDWGVIGAFLFKRFEKAIDEKLPGGKIHEQWPDFGRKYGMWFIKERNKSKEKSIKSVINYIEKGMVVP
jgi:hypothetical protein